MQDNALPNNLRVGPRGLVFRLNSAGIPLNQDGGPCGHCSNGHGCRHHGNALVPTPNQWTLIQRWQRQQLSNIHRV